MEAKQQERQEIAIAKQNERASVAAAEATSLSDLLQNRDVMHVICGPEDHEINNLRKLLRSARHEANQAQVAVDAIRSQISTQQQKIQSLQHQISQLQHVKTQVSDAYIIFSHTAHVHTTHICSL